MLAVFGALVLLLGVGLPAGLDDAFELLVGLTLVGLLHGTGAETPTQIALLAAAGASGSATAVALILGAFVAGLVVADLGIAGAWLSGSLGSHRATRVQIALSAVTGLASLTLGLLTSPAPAHRSPRSPEVAPGPVLYGVRA